MKEVISEPKPPFPEQHQKQPGLESKLDPAPRWRAPKYKEAGKLEGKIALITGGDSGIGRAVAYLYAREGADVAIAYLPEEETDATTTCDAITDLGRTCLKLPGDLTEKGYCEKVIKRTVDELGGIDILVSNAAHQTRNQDVTEVSDEELDQTMKTNVYAFIRRALQSRT